MNRLQEARDRQTKTRIVQLERKTLKSDIGFSMRGGAENGFGLFIADVFENSKAAELVSRFLIEIWPSK